MQQLFFQLLRQQVPLFLAIIAQIIAVCLHLRTVLPEFFQRKRVKLVLMKKIRFLIDTFLSFGRFHESSSLLS